MKQILLFLSFLWPLTPISAQQYQQAFQSIYQEGMANQKLPMLAHHFLDVIGPRLVGSPQMQLAHDFVVSQYKNWGIEAYNEPWGEWQSWQREFSHVDLLYPWPKTLEAVQMAWCPDMKQPVEAAIILLPEAPDSLSFDRMLATVKGKFVLVSQPQTSGRPLNTYETYIGKAGADSVSALRQKETAAWQQRIKNTGFTARTLPAKLEAAGAAGIISSSWTGGWGALKIFSARTKKSRR